ncbi:unnamed protein product [Vitrella brassicaformis CCMP3155]|uniref:Protein N-terminal glutamine amidohydrolase n=1 Tax=Vitrella brassicaformis (strain CCMP3155) TaxID=1169540 RepID=A0A0G4EJ40_VITBC|nr:unnamed protein product [Vitrella brassicaformis CCMP3155]|mmetsp:Transcript_827/g.1823  ORF Transcript_827/g.1823 Transcript_827/m.1823 type:complete len:299 (-) Transcript_827:3293-4189(-)|eukprot:CEL96287.1 unnamed protein product [Vitrella brassicaformis CCMP3155]
MADSPLTWRAEECVYTACYCEENVWWLCKRLEDWKNRPPAPQERQQEDDDDEDEDDDVDIAGSSGVRRPPMLPLPLDDLSVSVSSPPPGQQHFVGEWTGYAVFVTNPKQQTVMWRQKRGRGADGLIVWDYHVLFVATHHPAESPADDETRSHRRGGKRRRGAGSHTGPNVYVFDFDTTLGFPVPFDAYSVEAIRQVPPNLHRTFRVVEASLFLAQFASDRSHMRRPDGSWQAPPPSYPVIRPPDGQTDMNLHTYRDMDTNKDGLYGRVYGESEFVSLFGSESGVGVLMNGIGVAQPAM